MVEIFLDIINLSAIVFSTRISMMFALVHYHKPNQCYSFYNTNYHPLDVIGNPDLYCFMVIYSNNWTNTTEYS